MTMTLLLGKLSVTGPPFPYHFSRLRLVLAYYCPFLSYNGRGVPLPVTCNRCSFHFRFSFKELIFSVSFFVIIISIFLIYYYDLPPSSLPPPLTPFHQSSHVPSIQTFTPSPSRPILSLWNIGDPYSLPRTLLLKWYTYPH
jgi:hypothetical protein